MSDSYILNVNDGIDVLHRKDGLTESCNTDDASQRDVFSLRAASVMDTYDEASGRGAVADQIAEIQRITRLTDTQLAAAFPGGVTRETVNRWRNRPDPNLRPENLYRLGLLHDLAQRTEAAGVQAAVWLHQPVVGEDRTPFVLICEGRIAEVRQAIDAIAAGLAPAAAGLRVGTVSRNFDATPAEDQDEGDWIWEESVGDADE